MLIVCWNVAGLSTTVTRIHDSYGRKSAGAGNVPTVSSSNRSRGAAVLREYMERHGADIFCLQEHKIPLSQLSTRSEPLGCADVPGYESFWSCCVDQSKKGLNGVVTYVRKGHVPVFSANAKILGSPDLDDQGRCIMTDHGTFVLFNVYVPANSGQPLSYKMKFLNALRRAMNEQRTIHNKAVILVGDLNISHLPIDRFWSDRVLYVNKIRQEVAASESTNSANLPRWKIDLANAWSFIEKVMETKKVVPTQTTNSLTNQKYNKYRMTVQVNGKQVFLGTHETHPGFCEYVYDFDPWKYTCAETGEQILAEEGNVISIATIAELLFKISGVEWDQRLQKEIAALHGETNWKAPPRIWLNRIMEEDGMVDTFRHFYPKAEGRYTCWHQFTNKRYTNEGARIDFCLVDASLLPLVRKGDVESLRCGCSTTTTPCHHHNTEAAALCAATANRRFEPVSFEGGGIIEASQSALDTQFGTPHTGIIYTPPSFSDHTAISLLLDDSCCEGVDSTKLNEQDPDTRKAQPHKSQKSIISFFGTVSSSPSSVPNLPQKWKQVNSITTKRKNGIRDFFSTKESSQDTPTQAQQKRLRVVVNSKSKISTKATILNHFVPKKPC